MAEQCPYHIDHENRLKGLEEQMETVQSERVSAGRWTAILSLLGVVFTAVAGLVGTLLGFYAKSQGWL